MPGTVHNISIEDHWKVALGVAETPVALPGVGVAGVRVQPLQRTDEAQTVAELVQRH